MANTICQRDRLAERHRINTAANQRHIGDRRTGEIDANTLLPRNMLVARPLDASRPERNGYLVSMWLMVASVERRLNKRLKIMEQRPLAFAISDEVLRIEFGKYKSIGA